MPVNVLQLLAIATALTANLALSQRPIHPTWAEIGNLPRQLERSLIQALVAIAILTVGITLSTVQPMNHPPLDVPRETHYA